MFFRVLILQKERVIPQKKEKEDQQSSEPKRKRKVSVATPAVGAALTQSRTILCLNAGFPSRGKRKPSRTSWPPLSRRRAVQLTCRICSLNTSQTSAQWLSWRSSNCTVSCSFFPFNFHLQSISADPLRSPHVLPQTPVSYPVMTWHTHSPLIWNKVSHVWPFSVVVVFVRCFQPDSCVWLRLILCFLFLSLSQMGKDPKAAYRKEFSCYTDCLQLCASNYWSH